MKITVMEKGLMINFDLQLFEMILENLFSNALDAMPEGGELFVKASKLQSAGDTIIINVEDTGLGITKENLPFVFEPLFSTKPSSERVAGIDVAVSTVKLAVLPPRSRSPHSAIISSWTRSRSSADVVPSLAENVSVPFA